MNIEAISSTGGYGHWKADWPYEREGLSTQVQSGNLDRCRTLIQKRDCSAGRLTDRHISKCDCVGGDNKEPGFCSAGYEGDAAAARKGERETA